MPTVIDIQTQPASGLAHIDALLDTGPLWSYLTPASNTIYYSFSTSAGIETFTAERPSSYTGPLQTFNSAQKQATLTALTYLSQLTGIQFSETQDGAAADLHFAGANITTSANTTGLLSWTVRPFYNTTTKEVTSYQPDAYLYLDTAEWLSQNANPAVGTYGYQTLLHELGHFLGLKHPHEGTIQLPDSEDNTFNTLMSYEDQGGPYSTFMPYDIAALNFLYGGDGLQGALGLGNPTGAKYLTGTARAETLTGGTGNDKLQGLGGNDIIKGGAGEDTALFTGLSSAYTFAALSATSVSVTGADGVDRLDGVEFLQFGDRTLTLAQALDAAPPAAPTLTVNKKESGFLSGDTPLFTGFAEAGSTVKVYNGNALLGSTTANANGVWSLVGSALADGSYAVSATATDAAGNVSPQATASFKVDAHAPVAPTGTVNAVGGVLAGNQATFSGTAEAGTSIDVFTETGDVRTLLARTTADAAGTWKVTTAALVDNAYAVHVESYDAANNVSESAGTINFTVRSSLNVNGTAANDVLTANSAANNAFNGGAGIDTLKYSGARANYTVTVGETGTTISSTTGGTDSLVDIERVQFGDTMLALDVNGSGGQAYRLYRAAFDRVPDKEGLGFWINARDSGVSLASIANDFLKSEEYVGKFGANVTNREFLTNLYNYVMHRSPDDSGFDWWLNALDNQGASRANVLRDFSESPENQAQVIGSIQNGFEYIPFTW